MVAAPGRTGTASRWLVTPDRLVGIGRVSARLALAGLLVAVLATAMFVPTAITPPEFLHDAIVATLRHGGDYYDAARDLLRTEPDARAARALPSTLAVVAAALPVWGLTALVAAGLTTLLWIGGLRLGALLARSAGALLIVSLLGFGIVATAALWLAAPHAAAAALLSAIAVVARARGRVTAAVAVACAAALIDPAALMTLAVMAAMALLDGDRREPLLWLVGLGIAALAFALHLHALRPTPAHATPLIADHAVARLIGAAFPDVPGAIAAPLVVLAAFGWATVTDPLGLRVVALLVASVALDSMLGWRSATLAIPLVAPGLALVPAAIATLARAALDRRRITVTRVTR
ncbi:hypothetical protein [Sphingomonas phyllosphaerae]|uniref:hypothetical protein n=1 Tax=Sphingomonas phyllosphaerae TaxID=257003 RepID=UPI00048CB0C0|nr:hypothetical protein [Sphingomonas phyllosphaerae]